jgi:hypothetical protein
MTVLDRGFVWRSRWGVPSFSRWCEFVTTELAYASYLQWCDDLRLHTRHSRVEAGKLLAELYRSARPSIPHPVGEVAAVLPGIRAPREPEPGHPELPIEPAAAGEGVVVAEDVDWREKVAVIKLPNQRGYRMGSLEEARARFAEMHDGLPMPWD